MVSVSKGCTSLLHIYNNAHVNQNRTVDFPSRLGIFRLLSEMSQVSGVFVCLLVVCLTSQQHASVSQGRICTDNSTYCHTEIEVADPAFFLTQSQYTDTGPISGMTQPGNSARRETRRCRQRKRWQDNIREWTGLEWNITLRTAENREEWRISPVVPQRSVRLRDR